MSDHNEEHTEESPASECELNFELQLPNPTNLSFETQDVLNIMADAFEIAMRNRIIKLLNDLIEIDSAAVNKLFETRAAACKALIDHPTVVVTDNDEVGILGIINGLFSSPDRRVAATFDDEVGITDFTPYKSPVQKVD